VAHADNGITGDANCDAFVDVLDAQVVLQWSADRIDRLPCPENADANGNGRVNPVDALWILWYDSGLVDALP